MVHSRKSVEKSMHFGAKAELFRLAEKMRKKPTLAEKVLWKQVRKLRFEGFVFRRQHPIDFYIADFYCHKLKLVIEVDGDIHFKDEVFEHDDQRTGELERFGINVLRFTNEQVLKNQAFVLNKLNKYIIELTSPSLLGEGDKRG